MSHHRRISLAFATAAALAVAAPATASAGDVIKVRDACDPATFPSLPGPTGEPAPLCVRSDGDRGERVTWDEFLGAFPDGHGAWRFSSPISIDRGESVAVRFDRGGEFHTFSEVIGSRFGAGCVEDLNHLMGLEGPPVVDCEKAFTDPSGFISADFPATSVSGLSRGKHRFMCAIHPWMKTTVTVGED